jgi:hypothetical protein
LRWTTASPVLSADKNGRGVGVRVCLGFLCLSLGFVLISALLAASTAAVTYAVLSSQGKIGSSGRIIVLGVKYLLSAQTKT